MNIVGDFAHGAEMKRCIIELDIDAAQRLWHHMAPHMAKPESDEQTLMVLHMARTALDSAKFEARAYSHAWLCERSLPSQLPDKLKPRADRLYPRIVTAAAYSINFKSSFLKPIKSLVMKAIDERMNELWADSKKTPDAQLVLKEICDTKNNIMRALVGSFTKKE